MRNSILMAVLTMWLVACAANETNESAKSDDQQSNRISGAASDEIVCTGVRDRDRRGGSRLRRSCQ